MELRQLRYFVGVARALNFTRAARQLRVAQPALSRQIRALENELGVALLHRDQRGARLTPAGRAFLNEAQALLEQSELAVRAARGGARAGQTQITVGYVWGLFHSVTPQVVARFRAQCPEVAVHLLDLTATQQAEALADERIDLGFIGFAREADGAGLAKRKIGECAFVAALPAHHPAARRARVSLAALAGDFFIAISEQSYPAAWHVVDEACGRAGFRPRVLQAAERGHTILGLVSGGCGVALLPEPLRALPHPGVVFRPLEHPVRAELFVAWRAQKDSPWRERFLGCCSPVNPPPARPGSP